jgi:aminoglycoside 3-N-acetyltransferase
MAAIGAAAGWLTEDQPWHHGFGPGSPLAKLVEADGQVLLLGVPPDRLTILHHAELSQTTTSGPPSGWCAASSSWA